MAFRDYCSELVGTIPRLPYPLAQKYVNRAWKDICDLRLWSWLVSTADIIVPALITAGTVTATQGDTQVLCDAAATAALNAVALASPPLSSPLLGVGRQIRLGVTGSAGPVYSIVAWDGENPAQGVITLDRPYPYDSISNSIYSVYKCYYTPPDLDFLRYITVSNTRTGYSIRGKKLYFTQPRLNAVDPQRGATGDSFILAAFKADASGRPVHEWYPHPVNSSVYTCVYRKRGATLSTSIDIPATFPESVLIARAAIHAADWALANVATFPELQQTNWVMFRQAKGDLLKEELVQAIKTDDELSPLSPELQGSYADFPLGGEFMQGHDVSSLIGM